MLVHEDTESMYLDAMRILLVWNTCVSLLKEREKEIFKKQMDNIFHAIIVN